jgi:PKD repeat protein
MMSSGGNTMIYKLSLISILVLFLAACQLDTLMPPGNQNRAPIAQFVASSTQGSAPLSINFDASASTDEGSIAAFNWDFGDGTKTSGISSSHTFEQAGTFTVRLTVTDNQGLSDNAETLIQVLGADGNIPPTASFTTSNTTGEAPLSISFDASASADADGSIVSFSWNFGDGNTAAGALVEHSFLTAGTFSVTLTVTDNQAATTSSSQQITVTEPGNPNPEPNAIPVSAGVVLPLRRAEIEQDFSELGIDAVYFATQQTGNTALKFAGTITQSANGNFSYSATPTDRLQILFNDGLRLEYFISNLQGDFSQPDGERFIRKAHTFSYRLVTSEGTDVTVSLNRANGIFSNTVTGQLVDADITYEVNTTTAGQVISDINPPGVNFESSERVTGTISSQGFSVTLDETFRYHLVIFDDAIEDIEKTINNRWTIGSEQFALADARIFRTFKNGLPAELDSWNLAGQLTRNGQVIGGLEFKQTATSIDTVLNVEGESTVLFSDRRF